MPTVTIDTREAKERKNTFEKIFRQRGFDVEFGPLDVGDVVCGDVCIEIKEAEDLLSSIMNDDHLLRQIFNMRTSFEERADLHLLVIGDVDEAIEKRKWMRRGQISLEHYLSFMAQVTKMIPIMFVANRTQAAKYITSLIKHAGDDITFPMKSITSNPAVNVLTSIKGFGIVNAKNVCGHLHVDSIRDLFMLSKEDLMSVPGIGKNKAKLIMDSIGVDENEV